MTLAKGQVLNNRYRIVELLGEGGFGSVYRAWDLNLKTPCALKENTFTSEQAARQFEREAAILARLRHPNLPVVGDHFYVADQGQYLVMDYIEGEDLDMKLRLGGPLAESQLLPWIDQVLDALEYLHSQTPPVVHRDIKPDNIRITPQGRAMLVDFGIAKVYDPHQRTTIGARAVTPPYSPNEQYGTGSRTDARTDVYALGATLYYLLVGVLPPETPERNLGTPLMAPRELSPAISPIVEAVILRAMQMLPQDRFQSAAEMRAELRQATLLKPTPDPQPAPRPSQPMPDLGASQPIHASSLQVGAVQTEVKPVAVEPPVDSQPLPSAQGIPESRKVQSPSPSPPLKTGAPTRKKKSIPWIRVGILGSLLVISVIALFVVFGGADLLLADLPSPTALDRSLGSPIPPSPTADDALTLSPTELPAIDQPIVTDTAIPAPIVESGPPMNPSPQESF